MRMAAGMLPPLAIGAGFADSRVMHGWLREMAGRFVVFDGPDGSGKSTQFARLAGLCRSEGVAFCEVREPGGTRVGERIRSVLLDPDLSEMTVRCEMLLYMASRAQLVEQVIRPALVRGEFVMADRYVSSTLAYQGTAGGMSRAEILAVASVATGGLVPDLTLLFDLDERAAAMRLNPLLDRMEQKGEAFHRRVRRGFLDQAAAEPARFAVIDASRPVDEVTAQMLGVLRQKAQRSAGAPSVTRDP